MPDVVRGRTSLELLEDLEEFIPGGVIHRAKLPETVRTVFAGGKGSHIWDVDGNQYIDYILGSGPMLLGHAHPDVTRAVQERLESGTQFLQITDVTLKHARKVIEAVPSAEQVKFTGTGSEATYMALRLARAYTGKNKIIKFEGAFHGTHDYTTWSTNPTQLLPFPQAEPDTAGVPPVLRDYVLIASYNDADYVCQLIREHRDDLAAVILDPVTRMIRPRPEFLEAVRDCTREVGALFILDEVVSGFRVALGGAQELYGIDPDLTTLGKVLGGGLPIGAITGKKEFMSRMDPTFKEQGQYAMVSGTFSSNPLSATAGLAALEILEQPDSYQRLHQAGQRLADGFRKVCQMLEVPALVVNAGPTVDVKFTEQPEIVDYRDSIKADGKLEEHVSYEMIKRGVFHLPGAGYYISLAHSDQDLDETVEVFETALRMAR